MASYTVNRAAVRHARDLIQAKRWVLDSDWGEVQPEAAVAAHRLLQLDKAAGIE